MNLLASGTKGKQIEESVEEEAEKANSEIKELTNFESLNNAVNMAIDDYLVQSSNVSSQEFENSIATLQALSLKGMESTQGNEVTVMDIEQKLLNNFLMTRGS